MFAWVRFEHASIAPAKGLTYILKPNTSAIKLSNDLKSEGELSSTTFFRILLRLRHAMPKLQAGEYFFPAGSTPNQAINKMIAGKIVHHSFTIVDGWNIYQVLTAIESDPYVKHTLKGLSLQQIAKRLGMPHQSPEGLLFPDTYFFTLNTPDTDILSRAYQEMKNYLSDQWPKRKSGLPYRSEYQALIVASMVEKETAQVKEMPIIAAIILKRLKIWMHLQIDSTVIYGLEPHFNGDLTLNDLRQKTPYNTYTKYGLPPTPIAMPGALAIHAALHPVKTEYLYYVAKGDGSHQFSTTLAEQNAAVAKYQLGKDNTADRKDSQSNETR